MPVDYFNTDDSAPFVSWFAGTVKESYGDTPANQALAAGRDEPTFKGATETRIYWGVTVDEIFQEWENVPPELITVNWKIGSDWYADESGFILRHKDDPGDEAVENEKAKPILFKETSQYGSFLSMVRGARPNYDTRQGAPKVMDGGPKNIAYDLTGLAKWFRANSVYDSRDTRIWIGHRFLFRGLELDYGGNFQASTRPLPVAWLGHDDGVDSPINSAGAGTSEVAQVEPADVAATLPPSTSPELVEQVTALVGSAANFNQFMKNALVLDEVKADEELKTKIMDQSDGPWSVRK